MRGVGLAAVWRVRCRRPWCFGYCVFFSEKFGVRQRVSLPRPRVHSALLGLPSGGVPDLAAAAAPPVLSSGFRAVVVIERD
jgi:hypothetical protein